MNAGIQRVIGLALLAAVLPLSALSAAEGTQPAPAAAPAATAEAAPPGASAPAATVPAKPVLMAYA